MDFNGWPMNNQRGTTLIETLVYIGLFTIIIGGGMVATYQIIESIGKNQNKTIVESEGNFLLRKIDWALTGVSTISSPVASSTGPNLTVDKINFPSSPLVHLEFKFLNNNLKLSRDGGAANKLNGAQAILSDMVFEHLAAVGTRPEAVKASFTLSYIGFSQNFSTTKYLRK